MRGPLDVLRECWTDEKERDVHIILFVLEMQKKLQEMTELAQTNLREAQRKQKEHYDQKAVCTGESLQIGDEVLVLLPAKRSKLQLEWSGPYKITREITPVDFEVNTPGKRTSSKIYHVNLLRKWYSNSHCFLSFLQDDSDVSEMGPDSILDESTQGEQTTGMEHAILLSREDEELIDWRALEDSGRPPQLSNITSAQENDVTRLLAEFPSHRW